MTANKNFKRRVRAHAAKTGQSYTAALRHFRPIPPGDEMPATKTMRLAVAQTILSEDPRRGDELRESGREIRRLMQQAHDEGARLVHFPEGATCSPHKLVMSVDGPQKVGPADWGRFEWDILQGELAATAQLAGKLKLWTVLGAVHRLTPPNRPFNSLYVISDQGKVSTRYDERFLSNTKISYMYAPGSGPVTFDVDGFRFGCALGMEAQFPEVFSEYERFEVDCVLFSTTGLGTPIGTGVFATEAQGHAATNSYWVSYSVDARQSQFAPAGVISPGGDWLARCPQDETPSVVTVELDLTDENLADVLLHSRPWRRTARGGVYDPHFVRDDPRGNDRAAF
jgi:predicted amidohydrolase